MNIESWIEPFKYMVILSPIVFYLLYRKVTHPVCLFIGVLALQYVIYQIFQKEHYSVLTSNTELSIFLGMWSFLIGFSLISLISFFCKANLKVKLVNKCDLSKHQVLDRWFTWSILLTTIVIIAHLFIGYSNGVNGTYRSFLVNVRMQYLLEPNSFLLFPHVAIFLQSWFAYLIINNYKIKKVTTIFLVLSVLCALSKLERSSIITCFLTLIILKDHSSISGVPLKNIFFVSISILTVFFFVAWQFDPSRTISDILFVFLDYFSKNIDTFNKYISQLTPTYDWGLVLGKYAGLFGLDGNDDLINIDVDGSFNTYSYLKNLYMFGGAEFIFAFNVIIGAFFSGIYEFRYKMDGVVLGFLSFFSFSLFVSFFAYSFAWTNWAYYFISFAIIYLFTRNPTSSSKMVHA